MPKRPVGFASGGGIDSAGYTPRNKKEAAYVKNNPYVGKVKTRSQMPDEDGGTAPFGDEYEVSVRSSTPDYRPREYDDGKKRKDAGSGRGSVNPEGFKRGGYVKKRGWGMARQGRKRS